MAEEARQFLRLARRDLRAAEGLLDSSRFDEASWGFHVQQATEKALKACACHEDIDFPLTHDLRLLLGLLENNDIAVTQFGDIPHPSVLLTRRRSVPAAAVHPAGDRIHPAAPSRPGTAPQLDRDPLWRRGDHPARGGGAPGHRRLPGAGGGDRFRSGGRADGLPPARLVGDRGLSFQARREPRSRQLPPAALPGRRRARAAARQGKTAAMARRNPTPALPHPPRPGKG